MFKNELSPIAFSTNDLNMMKAALVILMAEYGDLDDEEHAHIENLVSDQIMDRLHAGCTLEDLTDDGRTYAEDRAEGRVVFRIPGYRHGDGQVDSDDAPIWLTSSADWEAIPEGVLQSV